MSYPAMFRYFILCVISAFLAACSVHGPGRPLELNDAHITVDTVWQGEVVIDGSVKVAKGATLTILPGTDVSFVRLDQDEDGLGDGTLIVEGELVAVGTRNEPIVFRSAATEPAPGDWLEIRVDFSRNVHLRYCEFRDSAYTLHAHFTRGILEDSHIHRNIDGCRLGEARFTIRNNLFEHNDGKAINFRNATVEITRNIIRQNGSGIFLFETDRDSEIHHNNIYNNLDNIRLGDFFTGSVRLNSNWWGSNEMTDIRSKIHDNRVDPAIGTVHVAPADSWVPRAGPRDAARLEESWRYGTEGFVDASVISAGDRLIVGSWDGTIAALDLGGRLLWRQPLGDVVDATPAWDGQALYVQTWGRELFALDPINGHELWRFGFSPSPADDHRQGSAVAVRDLVLLPAWNGTLYALDARSGLRRWQYDAGMPLRSAPALDRHRIYLAAGNGTLSTLDFDGNVLWQRDLGSPLLSTPALTPDGPVTVAKNGRLFAFDYSGRTRWEKDLGETCFYGSPLYADGALYVVTTAGTLWKLNASDGRTIWQLKKFGPIYSTPVIADGRIVVGDNDGTFSLVGRDSGTVICQFRLDGAIQGTPLVFGHRLVIGARDRNVYSLRPMNLVDIAADAD